MSFLVFKASILKTDVAARKLCLVLSDLGVVLISVALFSNIAQAAECGLEDYICREKSWSYLLNVICYLFFEGTVDATIRNKLQCAYLIQNTDDMDNFYCPFFGRTKEFK
jgi:hypothetical protein